MVRVGLEGIEPPKLGGSQKVNLGCFGWTVLSVATVVILYFAGANGRVALAAPDPMTEVKNTVNQVLAVLNDPAYKNSPRKLRDRLREIVEGHLDFTAMARSALGPHWRELSKSDQEEFVNLFRRLMEDTYIGKAANYSGEKVEFLNVYNEGPNYAQVNTNIIQPGRDPIKVTYRLELKDNDWKVYDVLVDEISLISNYRTQFNRVINRDGYPKLVELVKNKIQQLDASFDSK